MIRAHIATLVYTIQALALAVKGDQFVGFDDAPAGADALVQGVSKYDGAAGDPMSIIAIGLVELPAATAIAKGANVYSDANGAPTAAGVNNPVGRAVRAAAAPGDTVTLLIR